MWGSVKEINRKRVIAIFTFGFFERLFLTSLFSMAISGIINTEASFSNPIVDKIVDILTSIIFYISLIAFMGSAFGLIWTF